MARLRKRKFGRRTESAGILGATYVIKTGWSLKRDQGGKTPKRCAFIVCRQQEDGSGNKAIALDQMRLLGCGEETMANLERGNRDCAGLPTTLNFMLPCTSFKDDDGEWNHGVAYDEELQRWDKDGLMCHGDGIRALRRRSDGGWEEIECVPAGVDGMAPDKCCPYSVEKKCKTCGKACMALTAPGEPGQMPRPLDSVLGHGALYVFQTSSENATAQILSHLDQTADRLNGQIAGLPGVLTYEIRSRRLAPGSKVPVSKVGMVSMHIDEIEIQARERLLQQNLIEVNKSRLMLDAPDDFSEDSSDVNEAESVEPTPEAGAHETEPPAAPQATGSASTAEPEPSPLDDVPNKIILDGLAAHAKRIAENTGIEYREALDNILFFESESCRYDDFHSLGHFEEEGISDTQVKQRFTALRRIAQRLLDEGAGFVIQELEG